MIGCRIIFDKEWKIAIGKRFESGADYTNYFKEKTPFTTGNIEYYMRWSWGKMDQVFWWNLLAGNQPLWDGKQYHFTPLINSDRREALSPVAIQPILLLKNTSNKKK
jgi:hypothetical protein